MFREVENILLDNSFETDVEDNTNEEEIIQNKNIEDLKNIFCNVKHLPITSIQHSGTKTLNLKEPELPTFILLSMNLPMIKIQARAIERTYIG